MRRRLVQIGILVAAWPLAGQESVHTEQTAPNAPTEIESDAPCPLSDAGDKERVGPEISIAEVTFSGSLQMPISDQDEIAHSIKEKTHGQSLDDVTEEGLERARNGWQDRGYFKVQIIGETKTLTSSSVSQRIALNMHVDEGVRYNLGGITFKNNRRIRNGETLRGLFPITNGDIFSREKIATGLENLRKAYGELGYINFTSIPNTKFDDEIRGISLEIDIDEGKQSYVSSVDVLGLDEVARQEILETLPIKRGQIYNERLWKMSLLKHASMFPDCSCRWYQPQKLDEHSGVVALTLDFRPCSE